MAIQFDPKVCEAIGFYVYALGDPRTNNIFYVGKGVGNRCFAHIEGAKANNRQTEKLDTIRGILNAGLDVQIDIVRHGLDESTALEIEAALIDILGLVDVSNEIRGQGTDRGLAAAAEIQIRYGAHELSSQEPLMLVKIENKYRVGMTIDAVYEAARWCWKMNINRARRAKYVLAVANGIVRGVFKPTRFARVTAGNARKPSEVGRVYFEGHPVESAYLHTSTKAFGQRGQANPVRYVNM